MATLKFEFNEKGCCKNPITEVLYKDAFFYACIAYAQRGKRWAFGYRYIYSTCGGGGVSGVCFGKPNRTFATDVLARKAAIEHVINRFKSQNEIKLKPAVEKLQSDLLGKQLELL